MVATSEFREYENGVADVLASVVGAAGTVQRNVRLPSSSGVRPRQVDVLVTASPSGDQQRSQQELVRATLAKLGIPHTPVSNGWTFSGGTPRHRWLEVRLPRNPYILRVSAADEAELEGQLLGLASDFGVPRDRLTVDRPAGWPLAAAFPF
jgi:hypothetical protein